MTGNGYRQPNKGIAWNAVATAVTVLTVGGLMYASPPLAHERQQALGMIVAGTGHNASYAK